MKSAIHPEYLKTKVTCSGCGNTFDSESTVAEMHVDVCSNCHPFYTGKQKLVDTAGRVDRFKAKRAAAETKKEALTKKAVKALNKKEAAAMLKADAEIKESNTVEISKSATKQDLKPETPKTKK
jgi:large subunit ribosomal protein L31